MRSRLPCLAFLAISMVPGLPPGVGVNALLRENPGAVLVLDIEAPGILADLDTPEDYRAWSGPRSWPGGMIG